MRRYFAYLLLVISFIGACCCTPRTLAQTFIFNASPSAKPGEAVNLQGSFSSKALVYLVQGKAGTPVVVPALVQSDGQATIAIPDSWPLDLYQAWVVDDVSHSQVVYINKARGMHYDSPDVVPGGKVRIFGRNLKLPGATPQVRFVQQGNGTSVAATTTDTGSDAYKLVVQVPASLVPGKTYDVYVSNGFGDTAGEAKVEQPLNAIAPTANYFGLPADWGHHFDYYQNVYNVKTDSRLSLKAVGDGTTNDQSAIQQAIDKASQAGGGVVYLPAGTYKILTSGTIGLVLPSRVMVTGAGIDQTALRYGYTGDGLGILLRDNGTTFGFADMSIENVSDDGTWKSNMRGGALTEFVLQRVRLKLNKGWWLDVTDSNKLSVTNCEITQGITSTTSYRGPVRFDGSRNIVFANNKVTFCMDALNFNYTSKGGTSNVIFENNTIYRDGSARWPVSLHLVNHVTTFNFTTNLANLNNTYKVINGDPQNINDGETIIAEQGANYVPDASVGTVSSATANTLTDNTKSWGALVQPLVGVGIVKGKGMGQWRQIASRTSTTLTLNNDWDVLPDATSRYAIFTWGSQNWLVQGNTMEGNQRGITIYQNATRDMAIVDNVLTNNGSIDFNPLQANNSDNSATVGFYPMYNIQVVNNTVSDLNGKMGVFIGMHPIQHINPKAFGTQTIGFEVRNNTVTAHSPNTPAVVDNTYPNGYLNYLEFHITNQGYQDEDIPVLLGSIFQNNKAVNCNTALYLNSASYNTLVCNMQLTNTSKAIDDSPLPRLTHGAVRTTTNCTSTSLLPPVADPKVNPAIQPNTGPTGLVPMSGHDPNPDGELLGFKLQTLPSPNEGTVYVNGLPAKANVLVPTNHASMLAFVPQKNYVGKSAFTYVSVNKQGLVSAAAAFTLPVTAPLPVELVDFTATAQNGAAHLRWVTASEQNCDYFTVERSFNGTTFATVTQLSGQGTKPTATTYAVTDTGGSAGTSLLGQVYYRLRQVDASGTAYYSGVRTVLFSPTAPAEVSCYPNPTSGRLYLKLPVAGGAHLAVYSAAGALVSRTYSATTESVLDVEHLLAGLYLLVVQPMAGKASTIRFEKN